ncbi:MAG: bifunctional DNA primase/polymerase, partial [Alphaproteobacteria bacterium]|nr:bifunctional DNA primase/polymerase [Alphaproteobacteria bacterium]
MIGCTKSQLADLALALAARGLPVFPCSADKKPVIDGGFKSATQDPAVICEMFAREGAKLIGVPTGRASGRVVIDVDPQHGGNEWFSENKVRLPATLTHGTPRGGEHRVFRDPPNVEIRNSQGRIAPGVDVRGTGGYVIVPPSGGYTVKHNGGLADMPQWLIAACLKPERSPPPTRPAHSPLAGDGTPYGLKALDEECAAIAAAPFGQQETTLNNAALKIGGLAAGGELAPRYALAELI